MSEQGQQQRQAWEGEMFRLLAENVLDYAIFIVSPDRHVLSWSKGAERLLGYHEDEIVGRECDRFFTPEDVRGGVPQRELDEALATGRGDDDRWHVRKDGSLFWSSGTATPLRDGDGKPRGFAKIMRDRTDLKRAEEELAASRRRLQALFDNALDAVLLADDQARYIDANPAACELLGYGREELLRLGVFDITPPPGGDAGRAAWAAFLHDGRQEGEYQVRRRDGTTAAVEFRAVANVQPGLHLSVLRDVTERRRTEEALRESRGRLVEAQRIAGLGSWEIDWPTQAVHWSDEMFRLFGAAAGAFEPTVERFLSAVPAEDRPAIERAVAGAIAGKSPYRVDHRIVRADGAVRVVSERAEFAFGPDGEPARLAGTMLDVTERRAATEALRESEDRFARFMHHLPGLAWVKDDQGRYVYANEAAARAFGVPPEGLHGRTDEEVFPPATAAQFRENDRKAVAGGAGVRVVETLEQPDGVLHHSLVSKFPIPGTGGRAALVGGMAIDITEEVRTRAVLEESEERLRATFEQAAVGIAHVGPDGRWLRVNRRLCDILGRRPEDLMALTFQDLTHPDDLEADLDQVRRLLAGEIGTYSLEKRYVRKDRSPVWVNLTVSLVRTPGGEPKYFISVVEDVAEKRRAQEALRDSEQRLRALSDNLPQGAIYQTLGDLEGRRRFLYVSAGVERLFGVTPAEAMADAAALYGLVDEEDRPRLASAEEAALRDSAPFRCEFRSRTRSGGTIWVECRSAPRSLPAGEVVWEGVVMDVTARKQAEEELARVTAESQRRRRLYETILSNTPDLAYVFGLDHRFTYANEVLLRMWGRTWDEAIGKTCLELGYEPWHAEMHGREIEQVKATRRPVRGEVPFAGTFGRRVYEYIFVPVLGEGGEVEAVAGTTRDVTERKEAEERLRASAERFRAVVTQAAVGVAQVDLAGRFTLVNPRYCGLLGYAEAELLGLRMQDVTHPDDLPRNLEQFRALAAGGPDFVAEKRYVRRDGSAVWVSNSVTAVRDADGGLEGVLAVAVDLTDRRRAEEAVRESERRFRGMADAAPATLWTTDPDGHCTFLSREWYEFTGQTEAEALGLGWTAATHPDDQAAAGRVFLEANAARSTFRTEYRLRTRGGSYRWAVDIGRPRYSPAGEYLGMVGAVFDLEDRKQAERALEEAGRRKDEFLATLAHELRNPLAPIRNGLQLLRLAGADPATAGQALGMMERQLQQMVRLIDDLLDVSRITRGKLRLRRDRVELAAVVRAAAETARPLVEASAHRLAVELPPGPVWLDADPARLSQVFANLLNNAAKYTGRGGEIRLAAGRHGGEVVVSVRDNGVGIAAEHLPRLFEMFSQVDSALERSQGGLGIGLSLVKGLVEMHGGTVEARSEGPGKGSEFVVRLPVAAGPAPAEPRQPAGREAAAALPRRRILVADDSRDAADSLAMMLRLGGHEVHAARDGQEAVEAAAWFRPDVALLDIGMPRLNGYEAARRIREQPWGGSVVLVAVTGWGQEGDRRRAAESGFQHHLTKPANPADLEGLLASLPPR